jgi:hypothetical protein
MENIYNGLHKKLAKLKQNNEPRGSRTTTTLSSLCPNTNITEEEKEVLEKGLCYAIRRPITSNINRTIIDIENVLNNIDEQSKKGYRIIASNKLKRLIASNTDNTLHKRMLYTTRKLKKKLEDNDLNTVEADKGKICVIIGRKTLSHKIQTFLRENQYTEITTDPTQKYTKQATVTK